MSYLDLGFTEDEPRPRTRRQVQRRRRERRQRRRGRIAATLAFLVVIAVMGGIAWGGYTVVKAVTTVPDYKGEGRGRVTVQVQPGQTVSSIGMKLEKLGVVKSSRAFDRAAENNPDSWKVQPGYYQLNKRMAADLALKMLLDPKSKVQTRATIPEGLRASRTFEVLAKQTKIPVSKFQAAAKNPAGLELPPSARGKVEGYLFPDTYHLPPDSTARSILGKMVDRYKEEEMKLQLQQRAKRRGMSVRQVVTLASLIEAEAKQQDFGKVSRVAYNRVKRGMPLQFDSTITYVLNRSSLRVSYKDLKVKSPYNTYKHRGLPPGPIDNPGAASLKAALNPTPGNWLYFVTTNPKTGETKFTASKAEFAKFKREYKKNSR